jgi:hypothetical protein
MKKQIFALGISLLINVFCLYSFSQTQISGMTATASSTDGGSASYAVDGNAISTWESTRYSTGQWLQLNLPFGYRLSSIEIDWGGPYNNCTVQFYSGSTLGYTYSAGNNGSNQSILTIPGPSALVTLIKINADTYGPAPIVINEVKVLGTYSFQGGVVPITFEAIKASSAYFGNLGIGGTTNGSTSLVLQTSAATNGYSSIQSTKIIGSAGGGVLALNPDGGNVLIGKTTQNAGVNYKLDVNGSIRANEIKVNTSGADFVFEPTYKLRSLSEVETFIKVNKHLPEIAPAAEMKADGVSVSELQTKLLQKIEELTLYSIQQEATIQQLNAKLKKMDDLENELAAIKTLLLKK